MRTLIALPVFYVVSRAPQIGALLVAAGLVGLVARGGVPFLTGLFVLAIAFLGVLAVRLACTLPVLATRNGGRRAVQDVCWEAADDVADWAGWETGPPNP